MEVLLLLKWAFAIASVILAIGGAIPYYVSIFREKTIPPYSTFIGWTLVGFTMVYFQYQTIDSGDSKLSMMGVMAFAAIPLITLLLMISVGVRWTMERRDIISFLGLGICWALYVGLRLNGFSELSLLPMLALALTDGFCSWPIFQDCLKGFQSSLLERLAWSMTSLAAICELISVDHYWAAEMFIPGYLTVYMCSIAAASLSAKAHVPLMFKHGGYIQTPAE